ncbi:hypothetical protein ACFFGR_16985 [Arthrobacter liuii]|uniref:Uncharacterized protein n=1 Tax=Arthrobacter liuii TaxID=1476996 RepID=A0ABQ2B0N1_9MICC|nr:hypothetical protein [Arthrobacter liuii]GGI02391.1 hypothetical protein GCM10007170_44030 [Arthrobacter liuii]
MEKTVNEDPKSAVSGPGPAAATALIGSLLLLGLTGYLSMQLKLSEIHLFLGFDSRVFGVSGDWLPYVWRLSLVLSVLAAIIAYRALIRDTQSRVVILAVLAAAAAIASPVAFAGPQPAEAQPSLLLYVAVEGAKSPAILALIGAVLADLMTSSRRSADH